MRGGWVEQMRKIYSKNILFCTYLSSMSTFTFLLPGLGLAARGGIGRPDDDEGDERREDDDDYTVTRFNNSSLRRFFIRQEPCNLIRSYLILHSDSLQFSMNGGKSDMDYRSDWPTSLIIGVESEKIVPKWFFRLLDLIATGQFSTKT